MGPLLCCHLQGPNLIFCGTPCYIQYVGVLYIFYYINLVLPTFCYRVAALIVNNNMYTHLV